MNASTIASVVLGALLALAVAYIVHLRHLLLVPVTAGPALATPVTYGRRAGDRVEEYVRHGVHFGDVDALAGISGSTDEHGLDIYQAFFTGKAA